MGARTFTDDDRRVARVAQDALRSLLTRGQAPTPEAFARAYHEVSGVPPPEAPPREDANARGDDPLVRRFAALLSSALAALGAALPAERTDGAQFVDVAARLLIASKPAVVADDVERLLSRLPAASSAAPWREVCLEALRHIATLLPPQSESAAAVHAVRQALARARGAEEPQALERALRILRRAMLSD